MSESARPLRILLADDHQVVCDGLTAILNRRASEFLVVAEAGNGEEALALWRRHRPDISLLDLRMPKMDGVAAIKAIRACDPSAKLIILTTYDTDEDIYQGLRAGARGYLLKDAERSDILEAIRTVARGQLYLPTSIASKLATHVKDDELTSKERQVLQGIARGLTNKQVAGELSIGEGTVKSHTKNLFLKLGVSTRTEAVRVATERGLIRPPSR